MMTHHPGFKLILAVLICLAIWVPQVVRADFGDCSADAYLDRFPDAPSAPGLNCIELFRIDFTASGGARQIRGIQDISADWAVRPDAVAAVERGARLAAAAFSRFSGFEIDDVTLLILDDAHVDTYSDTREVLGIADGRRDPAGGRPGECLITLYMLSLTGDPVSVAVTVAHEVFHCLQYASLSAGQMATVGAGGDWWIEGSAEYFAALAVPDSIRFTDRSGAFDSAVDSGFALNGLAHEAVIFFYWLHQARGPSGLVPFMRGMAVSGDAPAQHAAMRTQLPDDEWLRFAQDYVDTNFGHPQGGELALSPPEGERLAFDENETLEFPLLPFVISLGWANYDCGRWRNTLTPDDGNAAAQENGEGAWNTYPDEVDARDDPPGRYRIAALHTGSEERTLSIEAERTVSCEPCGGTDELDACVAGTWIMTGGGLTGTTTVTHRGVTGTMPISQPGSGRVRQDYSCSESSLTTTLHFGGMSPMITDYAKLPESEPPSPP
jgi:hypothetical protein